MGLVLAQDVVLYW